MKDVRDEWRDRTGKRKIQDKKDTEGTKEKTKEIQWIDGMKRKERGTYQSQIAGG